MPGWLGRLFRTRVLDQQLDAELRFHLEQQIAENIAVGMTPEEACRRAQIALGGMEQVKQRVRDVHWENFLANGVRDLRFAIRSLNNDRRFALTAIFALALGIGASTVIFSVFYNLVMNPFAAKDAGRLAIPSIEQSGSEVFPLTRSLATYELIRQENHAFDDIVAYFHRRVLLRAGNQIRQFDLAYVTPNAFEFYGVAPLLGRGIAAEDGNDGAAPVFTVSYRAWIGDFNADRTILGKSFIVDGEARTLVGIMPPRFQAYGATVRLWAPINPNSQASAAMRPDIFLLGRLKRGVSREAAAADIDVVLHHLATAQPDAFPKRFTTRVQSAADYFLGAWGIGSAEGSDFSLKRMLYGLLAAGLIALLIACSNVANLLLARATVREKEILVRSALGASRGRLAQQLVIESFVLAAAACLGGCTIAYFGMKAVAAMLPQKGIGIGGEAVIRLDDQALLFALGVTILTTLICGLAPALHAARCGLQPRLGNAGKGSTIGMHHGHLRSGLVIGEVALSIVLLIAAVLMMRSFSLITHIDLGFNPENLVLAAFGHPRDTREAPERGEALFRMAVQRLRELPGVSDVAINNSLPGYNSGMESEVIAPATEHSERSKIDQCSEGTLRTLQMRLARGQWFSQTDVDSSRRVVVINKTLARMFFGEQEPIGKRLEIKALEKSSPGSESSFEIVGVVDDIKNQGPERGVMPQVFVPYGGGGIVFIRTKTAPAAMLHSIQQQVWASDKNVVFGEFETLNDLLRDLTYSAPEFALVLLASLAGVGMFLSVIGVFSVMAYTVALQTHDIGIRVALGAQPSDIVRMLLAKGLGLIGAGIGIGGAASLGLTRFLASQLWGVSATDPWIFASVVAGILLVGLAACFLPARRLHGWIRWWRCDMNSCRVF